VKEYVRWGKSRKRTCRQVLTTVAKWERYHGEGTIQAEWRGDTDHVSRQRRSKREKKKPVREKDETISGTVVTKRMGTYKGVNREEEPAIGQTEPEEGIINYC